MANQNAIQDDNQFPALIGHSGTAGTAETRRIVVNNLGAASVTDVALTDGSQKTKITDDYGFEVENTPMDEMRAVIPVRLVGSTFQNGGNSGTVDTNFWTATSANGGAAVQANGQVTLSCGTTANGAISLQSVRRGRYIGGSSNRFRGSVRLSAGVTNNVRRWGIFDGTNGAYFKLSGSTISVCTIKAGSETAVASTSWNGSTTVPTITDDQTYEIYITNKRVWFTISGTLVHTATFSSAPWTATTDLPILIDNTNSSGITTNSTLEVRVATIYRLGQFETQPISKLQVGTTAGLVLKYGSGNLHGVTISAVTQNSAITLYDNTAASGTVLWASGAMGAQTQPFDLEFHNIPFSIGLTLVIASANANVLVVYE